MMEEKRWYRTHEGQGVYTEGYREITEEQYQKYCEKLEQDGFVLYDKHRLGANVFCTYAKGDEVYFVSHYPEMQEMNVVIEPDSNWLQYSDVAGEDKVSPVLRQVDLEDFGESYVIRLRDGRLIIFDGGFEKDSDAESLMKTLKEFSPDEKPCIAAWIMTHPHRDHYCCLLTFDEKYGNQVHIEKFIYNFPDTDEAQWEAMPGIAIGREAEDIQRMYRVVEKTGAKVYRAHTGQIYQVGNVRMEILSSPDNTLYFPIKDFNHASLVIRMEVEGQIILWAADTYFETAKLAERYGDYLKSDIFQIPHHGFPGGEIKAYDLIAPEVCLVSSLDWVWLGMKFKFYELDCNQHLIYNMDIKEYFVGGNGDITLELPYEQKESKKAGLLALIEQLRK